MSSGSAALLTELVCTDYQNTQVTDANLAKTSGECREDDDREQDEDEEEDLDFNPLLKETPSMEASSSLSSEIEGLDVDVVDSGGSNCATLVSTLLSKATNQAKDNVVGDGEHGEEVVMQPTVASGGGDLAGREKFLFSGFEERKLGLISQPETRNINEKDNGTSSSTEVVTDVTIRDYGNASRSRKASMDTIDEDAICRRTRARYSLASFTLDELETFLQETDDEEDLQNVDDEEEYRKFLTAVLHDGDSDHLAAQGNENVEDEDEENDADFELEIEEALESDVDENITGKTQEQDYEAAGRRPETRQNKRQKASGRQKKKLSEQLSRPLRPLLPNVPIVPFPALQGKHMMLESAPHYLSSSVYNGCVNGFTPHQIGQLHCLIHEHVQLLIQVFSLCVLEPSRELIAAQVQGLISEMLGKRNQVLTWRSVPYPNFFFYPPYIHPSVPNGPLKTSPTPTTFQSSSVVDSFGNNIVPPSDNIYPSNGIHEYVSGDQVGHSQATDGPSWAPFLDGPVLSILDVAPLNIVGSYMVDVSSAIQEYQRRHVGVEVTCDTRFEKEPLFPLQDFQPSSEVNGEVVRGTNTQAASLLPSSESNQTPRKTLAATLVERTKKQSVAPVPKKIAKLALRFFPLFNPALFPHKPPPAPVSNRVLFTDAEDMLLAVGLMEYNTDWKAIQQHYLPCKSKHQIFVRQKNRSCSRATENPIKAVRRIKNSPLTAEEIARIREGLKIFKLDWMSVWKFVVPYRDPSLLPRQWRIATGTQKSYKADADKRQRRRLYETRKRLCKPAALARCQSSSEKEDSSAGGENNSGDDFVNNENEAYVHEAFLADWRPGTSGLSMEPPISNLGVKNLPCYFLLQEGSQDREQQNTTDSGNLQLRIDHGFSAHSQPLTSSHIPCDRNRASSIQLNCPFPDMNLRSSKSQPFLPPYQSPKTNCSRLVKLAPDLPPVNLPPSVRVMSQSAFKNYQVGAPTKVFGPQDGLAGPSKVNSGPQLPCVSNSGSSNPEKAGQYNFNLVKNDTSHLNPQDCVFRDRRVMESKDSSDLHMHPLLFQAPEDGRLLYYPFNRSTSASSSFNFFSRNQPQLNLSLFHNPKQANCNVNVFDKSLKSKEKSSQPFGIDFHPLLQRSCDIDSNLVTAHPSRLSVTSELLGVEHAWHQSPRDTVLTKSNAYSGPISTLGIPSSPKGKTNDLDLDIHLSFTSRKKKSGEGRDTSEENKARPRPSAQDSGTIETQNTTSPLSQRHRSFPEPIPHVISKVHDSGANALVRSGSDVSRNVVNDTGNQSLPEIVMEQEELSDSEEEIGEHVEFECEEMADSEGEEGSEHEQIGIIRNEDRLNVAVDKEARGADIDDQQPEPRAVNNSDHNVGCRCSEDSKLKLGINDQEKENPSSSLCLSVDSCPTGSQLMKPKHSLARNARVSAGKNRVTSRLNRSCKNTASSTKHVKPDMPQSDSLAATPARKSRKRAQRADSSSDAGRSKRQPENCSTGASVKISNSVNKNECSGL